MSQVYSCPYRGSNPWRRLTPNARQRHSAVNRRVVDLSLRSIEAFGCADMLIRHQHIGSRKNGDSQHKIKHLPFDKARTEALWLHRPNY